jgi:ABC-type polar amino acid transport system ATPase subunit
MASPGRGVDQFSVVHDDRASYEHGDAKAAADRVVFMSDGKIVEDAPTEKFFGNPEHARTRQFLGRIL